MKPTHKHFARPRPDFNTTQTTPQREVVPKPTWSDHRHLLLTGGTAGTASNEIATTRRSIEGHQLPVMATTDVDECVIKWLTNIPERAGFIPYQSIPVP